MGFFRITYNYPQKVIICKNYTFKVGFRSGFGVIYHQKNIIFANSPFKHTYSGVLSNYIELIARDIYMLNLHRIFGVIYGLCYEFTRKEKKL